MHTDNILISSARSGTNFYLHVFQKLCPDAWVAKEIFRPNGDSLALQAELLGREEEDLRAALERDPLALWTDITAACAQSNRPALAKIFYYHQPRDSALWAHFKANARIVHLVRRNQFDVYLSHQVAQQTGKWQQFGQKSSGPEVEPFAIDRDALLAFLDKQKENVAWTRTFFAGADISEVFYEDLAASTKSCAQAISDAYGFDKTVEDITISLHKQKIKNNAELVSNYVDIADLDTFTF